MPDQHSVGDNVRFLLGSHRLLVGGLVIASVVTALIESALLTLIAQAAAALVNRQSRVHVSAGPLSLHATVNTLVYAGLVLAAIRLALMLPLSMMAAEITAAVQATLRQRLFAAFSRASWAEQASDREGLVQELLTSQVGAASGCALQMTQFITSALTLLVLVASALALNVLAAIFVLVAASFLFVVLRPLNEIGIRRARALSQAMVSFASGAGEAIRLVVETRVFGVESAQGRRIDQLIEETRAPVYHTQMVGNLAPNAYRGMIYVLILVGLAILSGTHSGHLASLGAVVLLLVRGGGYGQAVQGAYQLVLQALPFVDRVRGATDRYEASVPPSGRRRLPALRRVTFNHVSFAYTPDRAVLEDVSFEVTQGEAIGIVGASGAGKTTLVQLLLRLRAPQQGRYLVNGIEVAELADEDWHGRIAYVPQEPRLLHASVADNISYYRELDRETLIRAARLARIHDEICAWSQGYDTLIGPRADAISGGQQQRICIARALAGRPELLVLDEPTSALDPESERLLQESLRGLKTQVMLFVVAHRMSTIDLCDRVMVIEAGRLAAFGTPEELRTQSAYYRSASALAAGTA